MVGNEKRGETVRQRKLRNEREKTVKGAEGERGDAIKRWKSDQSLFWLMDNTEQQFWEIEK